MADFDTEFQVGNAKGPAVWRDKRGVVHRAFGAEVHRGVRLMWTACGKHDIPANAAYLSDTNAVNCPDCIAASGR